MNTHAIRARVKALAVEIPGITFGYIGNVGVDCNGPFDDRTWYVFLPHEGRYGTIFDRVFIGHRTLEGVDAPPANLLASLEDGVRCALAARAATENSSYAAEPGQLLCPDCGHRFYDHHRATNGAFRCKSFGCGCERASVEGGAR